MDLPAQLTARSVQRSVATGAVVLGVVGIGSIAGAATDPAGHDADGMARHESMTDMLSDVDTMDGIPMGRMHGEMMSSSADMRRMHAHMMSRHPETRDMHAEMVTGG